jgi:hypothetical protein
VFQWFTADTPQTKSESWRRESKNTISSTYKLSEERNCTIRQLGITREGKPVEEEEVENYSLFVTYYV